MLDRRCEDAQAALSGLADGASIAVSGFGEAGRPNTLLAAVLAMGVKDLHVISNNPGEGEVGLAPLFLHGRVARLTCSFPRGALGAIVESQVRAGDLVVEVVPQGTLAERIRAAGAGIPAFYTPTGYGTAVAEGKETREFGGRGHVLELALPADVALVKARQGDRWGNLTYDQTARNFGPIMATAGRRTVVEVDEIVPLGELDPERVVTPGIFVDAIITTQPITEARWRPAA
ncbi:3-oxoacid CoA-transferase subunit A [Acuticoccus sp.]|uniref:3-oxoacid CoA-transferase subunit A n=1 Tax=Acuticoccus sp. TaxID=1904378 RepID=UPI003B526ABE